MSTEIVLDRIGWEIINISLEYSVIAWSRLPRLFLAVVAVNLLTHPLFAYVLSRFGRGPVLVTVCECSIVVVEGAVLSLLYRRSKPLMLFGLSLLMNAASYGTGLLLLI